jgi:pre-mRNA-splicing factor SYF1
MYLRWAEYIGGEAGERVWRRYLNVDSSLTERHIAFLLDSTPPRPLAAAKYLLSIARRAQKQTYTPLESKSPYQLFVDFLELVEQYAEDVGMTEEETLELQATRKAVEGGGLGGEGEVAETQDEPASTTGRLMRIPGPPVASDSKPALKPRALKGKAAPVVPTEPYDEDTDPSNLRLLDVEGIVEKDGLEVYKDQAGRLWTGLATYWIKRGEFERVSEPIDTN